MAYATKDHVYRVMKEKGYNMFRVVEGRYTIEENDNENTSVDDAVRMMEDCLESLTGNSVDVVLSQKPKGVKARGGNNRGDMLIKVGLNAASVKQGVSGVGVSAEVKSLMEQNFELQRKIDALNFEKRMDALEKKFDAKLEEKEDSNSITGILKPHVPQIISLLTGQQMPAAINGVGDTKEPSEADEEKVYQAVERLWEIDQDFPNTITKLADFAEKKPAEYTSYLTILKSQV